MRKVVGDANVVSPTQLNQNQKLKIMRKPVALLLNDMHIDKDCINDFKINWQEALDVCKSNNISAIIVGGDLWTSRASQTLPVLYAVKCALTDACHANILVTIANGNHCKVDQESLIGYSSIFEDMPDVTIVDDYLIYELERINLAIMSHFPENGSFKQKLDALVAELSQTQNNASETVLYIHEGIHGALGQMEIPNELPSDIFSAFKAVLVGHYHNRTKIKGTNIEYIGSSRQLSFGEDEEKGYTILFNDGTYQFVKNQVNIRYKTIILTYNQVMGEDIPNLEDGYKYRLKIKCTNSEAKEIDKTKLLNLGFSKIEVNSENNGIPIAQADVVEKYDKVGIQKEYVNYCNSKGINSELGIKYLSKLN